MPNKSMEIARPQPHVYLQFGERTCSQARTLLNQAVGSAQRIGKGIKDWTRQHSSLIEKIRSLWAAFVGTCIAVWESFRNLFHRKEESHVSELFNHKHPYLRPKIGKYYTANVRLGKTADEGYRWKKSLLRSATKSIELSANFAGGKEFRKILSIIEERMHTKKKLRTHIILNPEMLESEDYCLLKELQKKFQDRFSYLVFKPVSYLFPSFHTEENHVKALVVDEKYFVVGGTSIQFKFCREKQKKIPRYSVEPLGSKVIEASSRDNDLIGENVHSASAVRQQFFNLFALCEQRAGNASAKNRFFRTKGKRGMCPSFHAQKGLFPHARLKIIVGGPEHKDMNAITQQYVTRITKAKKDITLANLEFFPEKRIQEALEAKRKEPHHVPVTVITSGRPKKALFGTQVLSLLSQHHFPLVDTAYQFMKPRQVFHKKVAVFDDSHTIIGSYNLGKKSALFDYEMACVIKDTRVAKKMRSILREDKSRSKKLTREMIEQQPKINNFLYKPLSFFENYF